jgi:hypothetical protein
MYSITILFNYPSQVESLKMTTRTRFTKEQLIERFNLNKDLINEVIIHQDKKEAQNETV